MYTFRALSARFLQIITRWSPLLLAVAPTLNASLVQDLSALNAGTITTDASGNVTAWADTSGKGNNASPKFGSVTYPASNQFASGESGLDLGATRNSLQLLDAAKTDALFDFTGAASGNSGFAIVVSVRVDALNTDWSDVIGITSSNTAGGFGLRYSLGGRIQSYMGGNTYQRDSGDVRVAAGDSIVFAINYNASTGEYQLWDSLNNTIVSWTVPAGDFSTGADGTLRLGEFSYGTRYIIGSVGEVKIYDHALSASEFTNAIVDTTLAWATPASPTPFQHLDATISSSVIGSDPVTQWTDQSPSGNNATPALGSVVFPSNEPFTTDRLGVNFGSGRNTLELLNTSEVAQFLDFEGIASGNTGFSLLLSLRIDELRSNDWNDLIGTTSVGTANGFGLRYNQNGLLQVYLGGRPVLRNGAADLRVSTGLSIVFALNYDANTGEVTFWDSLNDNDKTWNVPSANFANAPLLLGGTDVNFRYISGSVGEVKIFDQKLSTEDFGVARDSMTLKWIGIPPEFPEMPVKPVWTIDQLLNWNPQSDADAPFNVGTVALQDRIDVPAALQANANAKSGQGGVQALDFYSGSLPQGGAGGQNVYTFSYWQYLEESVYWGGIGAINFVPPTGEMIDNAHRNGVPILGTIFFPPLVFGGNYGWVQTFLQKDGETYPAADKLIETAEYYGFDGWFINQETEGGTPADAAAMRDLIRYVRANSDITIHWYDSMREDGVINWQDYLSPNNDWYLRHNYSTGTQVASGELIANAMFTDFIDFFNPSDPTFLTDLTSSNALSLGLDPYDIFTGQEAQANNFKTSTSPRLRMSNVFPDGQNHITSLGFYRTESHARGIADQDLFWTGASADPRDTSATVQTGNWKGVAHNIPARSVINSLPFATDFNLGKGDKYYMEGAVVRNSAWYNRALQAILPTWRWIIDSAGTELTPELYTADSYQGGSCLRVSGTLDAANTMRLYLTDLPITADTRLKIVYKRDGLSNVESFMQVGVSLASSPTTNTFYDVGQCVIDGWNESIIDLSAHTGSTLQTISLKFDAPSTVASYEIRIGQIVVYNASDSAPEKATNVQELNVVNWAGAATGRIKWDHALGERYAYDVYIRLTDGSLVFVGSTPSNHYYFNNIALPGEYDGVVVQTVGLDMSKSFFSDESYPVMQIAPTTGSNIRLTWNTLSGAKLESKANLILPPDWQEVTGATIENIDGTSAVDLPIEPDSSRFFRLTW